MSPVTRAGKSSSALIAIVRNRDSILPEPTLRPLVASESMNADAYCRFLDACAERMPELLAQARR